MDARLFNSLLTSARQARDHAAGKRSLRTTELPAPPAALTAADIRALRAEVSASQAVFAGHLNVSLKLVQAWEAGRRVPEGPALRLLHLGRARPKLVFGAQGTGRATEPLAGSVREPATARYRLVAKAAARRAAKKAPPNTGSRKPRMKR